MDDIRPIGSPLEQLGTSDAKEEHRRRRPRAEIFEQLEQCRLRPVDVVDDGEQRATHGERLDERSHGRRYLARRGLTIGEAHERGDVLRQEVVAEEHLNLLERLRRRVVGVDPSRPADDIGNQPIRDSFAVGQTAALDHRRLAPDLSGKLADQPRLAYTRLADERHKTATALFDDVTKLFGKLLELTLAANERSIQ